MADLQLERMLLSAIRQQRVRGDILRDVGTTEGTMEHLSDGELRLLASKRIKNGEVPCTESPRVWAGPGRGMPCAICIAPIMNTQTEYEVEVLEGGVKMQTLHFHIPCHRAWAYECDKVPLAPTG